jgi:hypothetical protein
MDKIFQQYEHHGRMVFVQAELKDKHREHCLCYNCNAFIPQVPDLNCPIANVLFNFCILEGIVTPVWECPKFDLR